MYASQKTKISPIYYQYFLWLIALGLIARVTVFVRRRSLADFQSFDPDTLIDLYAFSEIIIVGIAILVIFISPRAKKVLTVLRLSSAKYLLVYYLICLASTFWSYFKYYTLFRSVQTLVVMILVFMCLAYYREFISSERTYLYVSLITALFVLIGQLKGGGLRISLSSFHTNQYSAIAGMAFVYCLGERFRSDAIRKKLLTKFCFLFGFLTLLGTSATSNIAAVVGVLVVFSLARRSKVEIILCVLAGLIALLWSGHLENFWMDLLFPGKTEHDILTLKGRTYLWDAYIMLIADNPIIGYGFAAVSRMGSFWGTISTTNTHNGFLEVLLGTGFLGGSFFFFWLVWLSKEMLRAYRNNRTGIIGVIGAFTVAMVNNMGRTMIGGSFDAPSAIFLVLLALFTIHIRVEANANVPVKRKVPLKHRPKPVIRKKPQIISRRIPRNPRTYY